MIYSQKTRSLCPQSYFFAMPIYAKSQKYFAKVQFFSE